MISPVTTFVFTGHVGEAEVTSFREALEGMPSIGPDVVLDLRDVEVIDLVALEEILQAAAAVRTDVAVAVVPGWAEDVSHLTGIWPRQPAHAEAPGP
jgi:anti-anti-sigma regulatory factor